MGRPGRCPCSRCIAHRGRLLPLPLLPAAHELRPPAPPWCRYRIALAPHFYGPSVTGETVLEKTYGHTLWDRMTRSWGSKTACATCSTSAAGIQQFYPREARAPRPPRRITARTLQLPLWCSTPHPPPPTLWPLPGGAPLP